MSGRSRGIYLENTVANQLRDLGYWVMRSAGSHGEVDLIAMSFHETLMIQCKTSLARMGSKEWNALFLLCLTRPCIPIVAYRPSPKKIAYVRLRSSRPEGSRMAGAFEEYHP